MMSSREELEFVKTQNNLYSLEGGVTDEMGSLVLALIILCSIFETKRLIKSDILFPTKTFLSILEISIGWFFTSACVGFSEIITTIRRLQVRFRLNDICLQLTIICLKFRRTC